MQFGLDVGIYGSLALPEVVVDLAQHAESAGFDSIWLADHVAFPVTIDSKYPYSPTGAFPVDPSLPLLEPIAAMGSSSGSEGSTGNAPVGLYGYFESMVTGNAT